MDSPGRDDSMNNNPYGNGYGPPPPGSPYPQYQQPQYQQQPYYPPQVVYVQNTVIKSPFNHTVHIVFDVLSCGSWLPIHLICWACH